MNCCILCGLLLILIFPCVQCGIEGSLNMTDFLQHRQKRSLVFEGGGIIKLIIGPILPIQLGDPISWRSMLVFSNFQGGQYPVATTPLYPWDKWENIYARSLVKLREDYERGGSYREDETRFFVYTALESYMTAQGQDGRNCLLRAICENAQTHQHVGIMAELVNIVLTPGKESLDSSYAAAQLAGKSGADCLKLYETCPEGASLLDQYMDEL